MGDSLSTIPLIAGVVTGVCVLFAALVMAHLFNVTRRLRRESRRGREESARQSASEIPLMTFNRAGRPGDPINLEITGASGQLGASFAAAGWYRADEIDLVTSIRISVDAVLGRKYSTAPVSNLYLYGRKEDYAFERPGKTVRQRDHVRFWDTGRVSQDGRPIWVGSATRDAKIELSRTNHLPTHGISPDLDAERQLIVSELAQTGYVIAERERPGFGKETHGANGGGDPYFTDGMVAALTLANVWTPPLATQVRGALGARIAQAGERLVRRRLPKEGLERAAREVARLKQRRDTHAATAPEQAPGPHSR